MEHYGGGGIAGADGGSGPECEMRPIGGAGMGDAAAGVAPSPLRCDGPTPAVVLMIFSDITDLLAAETRQFVHLFQAHSWQRLR